MRATLISPYPPKHSGIATYCSYLAAELKKITKPCIIAWNQDGWLSKLVAPLCRSRELWRACRDSDVVHVQYHPADFMPLFLPTLSLCKAKARVVITLHEDDDHLPFSLLLKMYHSVFLRCADALIVHTKVHKKALPDHLAIKAKVIPHGIIERAVKRAPTTGLIVLPGFINPWKGQDLAIQAMPIVLRNLPYAKLLIVGHPHDSRYAASLHALVAQLRLADAVTIQERYVPDKEFYHLLRTCEIAVLPYRSITMSGPLCHMMSWHTPCVCSDLPSIREATQGKAIYCNPSDVSALGKAMARLLASSRLQERMSHSFEEISHRNSWQHTAQRTLGLYRT